MKRFLPFLLFFVLVSVFARVMLTAPRVALVRAELARRGWRGTESIEPAPESA